MGSLTGIIRWSSDVTRFCRINTKTITANIILCKRFNRYLRVLWVWKWYKFGPGGFLNSELQIIWVSTIFFNGNAEIYLGISKKFKFSNARHFFKVWSRKIFTKWRTKIETDLQPLVKLDATATKTRYLHWYPYAILDPPSSILRCDSSN